jgi:hypothetical protein
MFLLCRFKAYYCAKFGSKNAPNSEAGVHKLLLFTDREQRTNVNI